MILNRFLRLSVHNCYVPRSIYRSLFEDWLIYKYSQRRLIISTSLSESKLKVQYLRQFNSIKSQLLYSYNKEASQNRELFTTSLILSSDWGSKKRQRLQEKNLNLQRFKMANYLDIEKELAPLRAEVLKQGNIVRKLKAENAPEIDIKRSVMELKQRKKALEEYELKLMPSVVKFDRLKMEDLLKRRFFYDQSFSIYGGISGQYDYGPMGCALKSNILTLWRQFFILEEQMLETDCSILTPEPVLKASGHVDRFADLMVKDVKNGECFRLDHLIKNTLEKICADKEASTELKNECENLLIQLDGMTKDEMADIIKKFHIKSPLTNNDLSEPIEFNLMFSTQIGPTGVVKAYLRPETAQGIFVNFKRLLDFNQGKLPFAAAQIGNAFRNEISPRSGLIRVREFTMAEIEHFCDPTQKDHPKFQNISQVILTLYSACNQMDGKSAEKMSIGEAVSCKLVANETLGYYMARIYQFLTTIGIKSNCLRFRQHLTNEMAHYACDCWDAECLTSYGWVECVGCADRAAYDLKQHMAATGIRLGAEKRLSEARVEEVLAIVPNKAVLGKFYKNDSKRIIDALAQLTMDDIEDLERHLINKKSYELTLSNSPDIKFHLNSDAISVKRGTRSVHVEEIIPSVVEPSFGIGRILYALLEQNFKCRVDDEQRCYFTLPPIIAPIKCSILPLSNNFEFTTLIQQLTESLKRAEITYKVDDSSGSIGRRYARTDEIAIPFGITIDFDSLQNESNKIPTVTLRERDTMKQIRLPLDEVANVVKELCTGRLTWMNVLRMYPLFEQQQTTTNAK